MLHESARCKCTRDSSPKRRGATAQCACAPPGFRLESENILSRLKLSLCALIGVVITILAALTVFPSRASARLRRSTARILERTGSLAFQLLGEFCEVWVFPSGLVALGSPCAATSETPCVFGERGASHLLGEL